MPDPNESDRDRILRLIDGGPEVLKEVQEERGAKSAEEAPKEQKVPAASWRSKITFLDKDLLKLLKLLLAFALIFVCLYYASELLKTMKKSPAVASPVRGGAVDLTSTEDESGVGLRLVGVDSSDAASSVALLENLKSGKTYFARLNDRVGDAKVTQIEKNKVVVSVHGKTVELR